MDPRAQEFWPRNHTSLPANQIALVQPHIYYAYPPPPPFPTTGLQFTPFYQPSVSSPAVYPVGQAPAPAPVQASSVVVAPRATAAPTRAVVLSWVSPEVTEEGIRRELEVFGAVRAVEMAAAATDGVVTVHFYDLRSAQAALTEIRAQHMQQQCWLRQHYVNGLPLPAPAPGRPGLVAGRAVWAQFTMPETVPVPDGHNQGTIVVFNLDYGVSTGKLKEIFEAFGPVKELRETPLKRHQRFVEFYDVRDAARAIKAMEGKEINGKRVLIEFSRPGGHRRRFSSNTTSTATYYHDVNNVNSSAMNNNINNSSRTSNNSSSSYYSRISIHPPVATTTTPVVVSKSFRRSSSDASNSTSTCSNSHHQLQNQGKKDGYGAWNSNNSRRWNYGEVAASLIASLSIETSENENSNGSSSTRRNSSKKRTDNVIINCSSPSSPSSSFVNTKQQQHGKQQNRNHRSWKGRHKSLDSQFLIDKDAMVESRCGARDTRTTVMIKNIPNKYSQKLLLNMLDNHCIHCNEQIADGDDLPVSSYDFVYLPIDFNNKCNVGYGFVNLTSPEAAWRLYQAFHMQHWEVFNSRKICEITYARLQGLEALKQHFKNSKFACDTDEYLPVVFDPPRDGKQLTEPVAIGGHAELVNKVKKQQQQQQLCNVVGGDSINASNAEAEAEEEEEEEEDGVMMMHEDYEAAHDDHDDDDGDGDGGSCSGGDGNDDIEEEEEEEDEDEEEESGATTSCTATSAFTPDFATPNGVLYAQQN